MSIHSVAMFASFASGPRLGRSPLSRLLLQLRRRGVPVVYSARRSLGVIGPFHLGGLLRTAGCAPDRHGGHAVDRIGGVAPAPLVGIVAQAAGNEAGSRERGE